jgi:two-component system response regulator FixJ
MRLESSPSRAVFHFPGRPPLTLREREVLFELIDRRLTKEIANRMNLSPRTVESHRVNIMHKVGAKNPAELVRLAITAKRSGT